MRLKNFENEILCFYIRVMFVTFKNKLVNTNNKVVLKGFQYCNQCNMCQLALTDDSVKFTSMC